MENADLQRALNTKKVQADASKLCLAAIQSDLKKKKRRKKRKQLQLEEMLPGQELYWNTIGKQQVTGALRRFQINRQNSQTLIQSPAQQNGL